ncbi:MAG: hypothetical protein KKD44_20780 [Proteobacteria bacterium]|nr:hypothetical protein [Pseudomonadota bacterium]
MNQVHLNRNATNILVFTLVLAGLILSAYVLWQKDKQPMTLDTVSPVNSQDETSQKIMPGKALPTDGKTLSEEMTSEERLALVKTQQTTAAQAALSGKPVSGVVTQRPDFVSQLEWQVLQGVAKTGPESDTQLTHLVNKLLFTKKQEAWQSLIASKGDPERRHLLAKQLIDMIPDQVNDKAMGPDQADKMKRELMDDLNRGIE